MLCSSPLGQSRSLHKLPASDCFGLLIAAPRRVAAPIPSTDPHSIQISLRRDRVSPCRTNADFEQTEVEEYTNNGSGESVVGDGVCIEMTKTGMNSRRIVSCVGIDVNLDVIWGVLTDYERLAEFIPGLSVCELLEKRDNFSRLYQASAPRFQLTALTLSVITFGGISDVCELLDQSDDTGLLRLLALLSYISSHSEQFGKQDLAFGLKFGAKVIVDCFEKDLESSTSGNKRDIEFKIVEGDFDVFEGKWSIEQKDGGEYGDSDPTKRDGDYFRTTLSYVVDVKPKLWLPVRLVEGRLCKEIQTNLLSIREEAHKATHNPLPI